MNLQEAFNQLKKQKHDVSFDGLGEWLDQNTQKPKTMKNIYKIAASFIFATMILIACTVPVQQEEEVGYMIKGIASSESVDLKSKLSQIPDLDPSLISVHQILHEQMGNEKIEELSEIMMVLAEANYEEAKKMSQTLGGIFDFRTIDILPIEEKVDRTIYQSVLRSFDVKVDDGITEDKLVARINSFIHEHSSEVSEAKIKEDKDGNRYVAFSINSGTEANIEIKRSVESLYNDLTPKVIIKNIDPEKKEELKQTEILKLKEIKEEQKKNY